MIVYRLRRAAHPLGNLLRRQLLVKALRDRPGQRSAGFCALAEAVHRWIRLKHAGVYQYGTKVTPPALWSLFAMLR